MNAVIACASCHVPEAEALDAVPFPSGTTVAGLGPNATCSVCHQGRQSGPAVARATSALAEDTVSPDLSFLNVHYGVAAAVMHGSEVEGGYQYPGLAYAGRFMHVPSANTILIHRADKFGLAQLHQLRGRVGRSHHQAYSYLLVHDPQGLTKQAQRRLEAIQQMEELGSGFYLAMHDLEIRGTGEVLGDKQSGEIQEIGFQLYTDMLGDAVKALKDGKEPDLTAPLAATPVLAACTRPMSTWPRPLVR